MCLNRVFIILSFFVRERIEINKKKLLEIARRNVINMIKQGTLSVTQQNKAIAAIQSGGKTVDELTGNSFVHINFISVYTYTYYPLFNFLLISVIN